MKKYAVLNEFSVEAIRDALQKLDDFDKLIVNGLTAFQLNEIEQIDPILFSAIAGRISEGRWNPFVGLWCANEDKISEENLARNVAYSVQYFRDNFNKKYRVMSLDCINNNALAQIAYVAGFDACYIKSEKECYWLESADNSRTLVTGEIDAVDVNDISDDEINENEFGSIEDLMEIYRQPLDLKTVHLSHEEVALTDSEEFVLLAEKISAQNGEDVQEDIENIWLGIFLGEDVDGESESIISGRFFDRNHLTIDCDDVDIVALKLAEDGSGDTVIRLKETAGREHSLFVMSDALNAGFRCQITPYELQTFRIDKEGFATEIFLAE